MSKNFLVLNALFVLALAGCQQKSPSAPKLDGQKQNIPEITDRSNPPDSPAEGVTVSKVSEPMKSIAIERHFDSPTRLVFKAESVTVDKLNKILISVIQYTPIAEGNIDEKFYINAEDAIYAPLDALLQGKLTLIEKPATTQPVFGAGSLKAIVTNAKDQVLLISEPVVEQKENESLLVNLYTLVAAQMDKKIKIKDSEVKEGAAVTLDTQTNPAACLDLNLEGQWMQLNKNLTIQLTSLKTPDGTVQFSGTEAAQEVSEKVTYLYNAKSCLITRNAEKGGIGGYLVTSINVLKKKAQDGSDTYDVSGFIMERCTALDCKQADKSVLPIELNRMQMANLNAPAPSATTPPETTPPVVTPPAAKPAVAPKATAASKNKVAKSKKSKKTKKKK